MNEIQYLFLNNATYPDSTFEPEIVNVSTKSYISITIKCSVNCDIQVEYMTDENYSVIKTFSESILAGTFYNKSFDVETRYMKFSIINIASNPCSLEVQGFSFSDSKSILENVGGYAELLVEPKNYQVRSIQSSDASITITENADNIDIKGAAPLTALNTDLNITGSVISVGKKSGGTSSIALTGDNTVPNDVGRFRNVFICPTLTSAPYASGNDNIIMGPDAGFGGGGGECRGSNNIVLGRESGSMRAGASFNECIYIGRLCGNLLSTATGSRNDNIGMGYFSHQGADCRGSIGIGRSTLYTADSDYSVALGYNAGISCNVDFAVMIGANCSPPSVAGRLCFGNNLEAITTPNTTATTESGFMNLEWNGTHYRIPVYPNTTNKVSVSGGVETVFVNGNSPGNNGTSGWLSQYTDLPNEEDASYLMTRAGTIKNMYGYMFTPMGVGETKTITIYKNGVASSLSLAFTSGVSSLSDTSNTLTVSAFDRISVKYENGTPSSASAHPVSYEIHY